MLRYIGIHPKQDVLPTAWRYLGRRRGEPAAAIVIRRGVASRRTRTPSTARRRRGGGIQSPPPQPAGQRQERGSHRRNGSIRLCSLASQHRLHQSQERPSEKKTAGAQERSCARGRTLTGCEAHPVERCGLVDERTRVEIGCAGRAVMVATRSSICAARTSAWFSVRKRRHS